MSSTITHRPDRKHPLENRIPPPLVVLVIGVAMGLIAWVSPTIEVANTLRFPVGGLIMALGAFVVVQGARTFWRNKTTIDPVDIGRATTLVTSGIFRFSRNPMYAGFTTVLIGWAAWLAAPWALLGPVAFALFTDRFQIIPEERMMQAQFGQAYDDYRARAPRWV